MLSEKDKKHHPQHPAAAKAEKRRALSFSRNEEKKLAILKLLLNSKKVPNLLELID